MRRLIIIAFAIFAVISFTSCHEHTYSSEWSSDNISHWHDSTCGHNVKSDIASHIWVSGDVIQEATYDSTGLVLLTCEVCGQTRQGETPRLERQIDIEGTLKGIA